MKKLISAFLVITGGIYLVLALSQFRFFIVQSGSMEPAIPVGSVVAIFFPQARMQSPVSVAEFNSGDIISYKLGKEIFTHRIMAVEAFDNRVVYKTKGDANRENDREVVSQHLVLGKVVLIVPALGRFFSLAQTHNGHIAFIIVPATIIIYRELEKITSEIKHRQAV